MADNDKTPSASYKPLASNRAMLSNIHKARKAFVDKEIILYLPPSNEVTGLPTCGVSSLINRSLTAL